MARHRRWLARPEGTVRHFDMDDGAIGAIIDAQRARGGGWLTGDDARAVLRAAGIPVVETRCATSADEAAAAAAALGLPVAHKILSRQIVHKTDVGGVVLDLRTADDGRSACEAMIEDVRRRAPDAVIDGVLVEQYVKGGREVIIGLSLDPAFGPVLMFGLGGIHVEALRDVTFRVQPVTDLDAQEMIGAIRGVRLLEGVRGEPPVDRAMLAETIERVSQLAGSHAGIVELDINPFIAFPAGGTAVDARIRVREVS
jgi:acetyltransferase